MTVRKNIYQLTPLELRDYISTVRALKLSGEYDNLIQTHFTIMSQVHGTPMFLPWHRAFLLEFERRLQAALGDSTFGVPVLGLDRRRGSDEQYRGDMECQYDGRCRTSREQWPLRRESVAYYFAEPAIRKSTLARS